MSRTRFPVLPYFLRSSESGTGSTQPCEYNWGVTWKKKQRFRSINQEYGRRDPSRWPCSTLYPQKLALTLPTFGGLSAGIVRSQTQATEFVLYLYQTNEVLTTAVYWDVTTYGFVVVNNVSQDPSASIFRENIKNESNYSPFGFM
jgi:hypothetical protein